MTFLLEASHVWVRRGAIWAVRDVSLGIRAGELWGLVGPNGAGKSTLIETLLGALVPGSGTVHLLGRELGRCSRLERARTLALVGREQGSELSLSARALVELGRFPHRTAWGFSSADALAVSRALEETGALELATRPLHELSDGERQRVHFARALAQDARVLLLDEATAHLDVAQRERSLGRARRFVGEGRAVIAVLHDLDLAVRYCTHLALLAGGSLLATGAPADVLTRERLHRVFQVDACIERHERGASLRVFGASA